MHSPGNSPIRKRLMNLPTAVWPPSPAGLDLLSRATLLYSSEDPDHPLECVVDGDDGPGGTHWAGATPDATEQIVLQFDRPEHIGTLIYEVEECHEERTQEVRISVSRDEGHTYRQILVQEYNFSPRGATFQQEHLQLELDGITHLKLMIVPNKGGSGIATLTALRLLSKA